MQKNMYAATKLNQLEIYILCNVYNNNKLVKKY